MKTKLLLDIIISIIFASISTLAFFCSISEKNNSLQIYASIMLGLSIIILWINIIAYVGRHTDKSINKKDEKNV